MQSSHQASSQKKIESTLKDFQLTKLLYQSLGKQMELVTDQELICHGIFGGQDKKTLKILMHLIEDDEQKGFQSLVSWDEVKYFKVENIENKQKKKKLKKQSQIQENHVIPFYNSDQSKQELLDQIHNELREDLRLDFQKEQEKIFFKAKIKRKNSFQQLINQVWEHIAINSIVKEKMNQSQGSFLNISQTQTKISKGKTQFSQELTRLSEQPQGNPQSTGLFQYLTDHVQNAQEIQYVYQDSQQQSNYYTQQSQIQQRHNLQELPFLMYNPFQLNVNHDLSWFQRIKNNKQFSKNQLIKQKL